MGRRGFLPKTATTTSYGACREVDVEPDELEPAAPAASLEDVARDLVRAAS